jgi:hypothetical protein
MYLSLLEDEAGGKKTLLTLAEEIELVGEVDEDGKECVKAFNPRFELSRTLLGRISRLRRLDSSEKQWKTFQNQVLIVVKKSLIVNKLVSTFQSLLF